MKSLVMNETTEAQLIYLRQAAYNAPAELVIGRGDGSCTVYVLRPTQLKNLVLDGTKIALGPTQLR